MEVYPGRWEGLDLLNHQYKKLYIKHEKVLNVTSVNCYGSLKTRI